MKKIIIFFFLLSISITCFGYDLPDKNQKIVDNIKIKALKLYVSNPNNAYIVIDKIKVLLPNYLNNPILYYSLDYILKFSNDFVKYYEESIKKDNNEVINKDKSNIEKSDKTSSLYVYQIDNDISSKKKSLENLNISNLQIVSSFDIEAKIDHIYLKNIYLKNTGTINDLNGLFGDIYLLNSDNKIVSKGYVLNNYFYFDTNDYIIKRNTIENFHVYTIINAPKTLDQTGELTLKLSNPVYALDITTNGIRATSYSNGNYIVSTATISIPIKTYIGQSKIIVSNNDFIPSYMQAIGFSVKNNSDTDVHIYSFKLYVDGSFLSHINDDTEFVLKRKGTNIIYGTAYKSDIFNNIITINYTGSDLDYISSYSISEYVLGIKYSGVPEGYREVRLDNIIVGDGFGGIINNLKDYNNFGLPSTTYEYRY